LKFEKGENLTKVEEYYAGTDTLSKLVFHTSFGNTLSCADESETDAYRLKKVHEPTNADQHIKYINQDADGNVENV
jgi:hypothetical protein